MKFENVLTDFNCTRLYEDAGELPWFGETKRSKCVSIGGRRFDIASHDLRHDIRELIQLTAVPNGQRDGSSGLDYAQHSTQRGQRIRKKHCAEPTDYRVKRVA